jgi:hypothetical protein
MANFTPISAAIGGTLIGLAAVLLMLWTGRIAGISGIFGGLLDLRSEDKAWRIAFIAGLISAPILSGAVGYAMAPPVLPASWTVIAAVGLLVGFGTRPRRRLHFRPRHLRDSAAVHALRRGHRRLHGDGGRNRRDHPSRAGG